MLVEKYSFGKSRIKIINPILLLFLFGGGIFSCSAEDISPQDILAAHQKAIFPNSKPASIENITTLANCKGPEGSYITITESGADGYMFFHQNFFYKDDFRSVSFGPNTIYGLDDSLNITDTLSPVANSIIKSHEFHKIMLNVEDWFHDFSLAVDTTFFDTNCKQLMAYDQWDQIYHLFFDQESGKCVGFQLYNPGNRAEKVRIFYKDWALQEDILLFDKIDILQGADQRYTFDFERVKINDPNFNALNL